MDTETKPASPAATGWCPYCSYPTESREEGKLSCKYGHTYSSEAEVHVAPSSGGDDMDDIDHAILQMERYEAANAPAAKPQTPAARLQAILDIVATEYGGNPPAIGELTDEERASLKKKLGAVQENAEAQAGSIFTAPAKPLGE